MRNIAKQPEPRSLTAWRATNPDDYDGYAHKEELRASLVAEQRGLCCYCESKISPQIGSMKIEHWASQSNYPAQSLAYSNLLAACMGGEGNPRNEQHCDTFKGQMDLCRNPADPSHNVEAMLHYLNDGSVTSPYDPFGTQLNSVLNLNNAYLKNRRKSVLDAFKKFLAERGGTLTRPQWQTFLDDWSGANHDGELKPYCSVIVYWIRKMLARP